MAKLVPLFREGADDVERMLLASARSDGPPDTAARDRTLKAVKAASRTAAVVGATTIGVRWLSALKTSTGAWVAVGGIGVAVSLGGVLLTERIHAPKPLDSVARSEAPAAPHAGRTLPPLTSSAPSAPTPPASPPSKTAPPSALSSARTGVAREPAARVTNHPATVAHLRPATVETPPAAPVALPASSATPPPAAAAGENEDRQETRAPTPSSSPVAAPAPPASAAAPVAQTSLRREASLLESIRESLATSHVESALASLDSYEEHFPSGALAEEAAVLRIEALLAAGRQAAAEEKIATFDRRYPGSSYGPRVHALARKR